MSMKGLGESGIWRLAIQHRWHRVPRFGAVEEGGRDPIPIPKPSTDSASSMTKNIPTSKMVSQQ